MQLNSESLQRYEAFLATLQRNPEHFKNKSFEADLRGELNPSALLDKLYFDQQRWLSFEEFLQHYLSLHGQHIMQQFHFRSHDAFVPGLRARLYRTQFGFLTEYHAYLLCAVFFGSANVHRSVDLDKAGVDFQLRLDGKIYNIHIFVDNERAWSFRQYKSQHKHVDSALGIHVNLPYSLTSGRFNSVRYLPNGFGVYQESYLQYFVRELKEQRIQNGNIIGTTASGFVYKQGVPA